MAFWDGSCGFLRGCSSPQAGLLALITPERLRSWIGQGSETANGADGPVGKAIFVGAVFAGIGLLTVVLLFSGILLFGAEDYLKGDEGRDRDDFNNADIAASMGRWDKALESYDDIISRNQSNALAWKERGYALEKLGRYDEANESYEKARELESEDKMQQGQPEDVR